MRRTQWIFALLVAASAPALALEVGGVQLADSIQPDPGAAPLVLNGAGVRQRLVFKVYSVGLYLRAKTADASQAISSAGPKRVSIHMLRDVSAEQFTEALVDGIRANHAEAEVRALEARTRELSALMAEVKEARKGMAIAIDWLPEHGTVISIDGRARGKPIAGEDFYRALLRIWLGERPAAADLKKALLGQAA
jgi:hypothetical protein